MPTSIPRTRNTETSRNQRKSDNSKGIAPRDVHNLDHACGLCLFYFAVLFLCKKRKNISLGDVYDT